MLLAWVVFLVVVVASIIDIKRTTIMWMAVRLCFNAQVALRYAYPAMSLDFGVCAWLVFVFCISMIINHNKGRLNSEKFYLKPVLIAIIISYSLSFAFSIYSITGGLRVFAKSMVMDFAIVYVFQRLLYDKKDIILFSKTLFVVAIAMCFLSFYESFFHDNPVLDYVYYHSPQEGTEGRMWYLPPEIGRGIQYRFGMVRAYSFFGIHIAFGCACAFIAGFFLFVNRTGSDVGIRKKYMSLVVVVLLFGCFASNSKTAYLGLVVMMLMAINLKKKSNIRMAMSVFVALLLVMHFFPNYLKNASSFFDEELAEQGGGSTLETRKKQFAVALEMFQQSPIVGNGPGSIGYMKRTEEHYEDLMGAEGALLKILPERGIVGYAVYLFTFIYIFVSSRKRMPGYLIFVFLASLFAMELASGLRDKTLYYGLLIAIRRICLINSLKMKSVA